MNTTANGAGPMRSQNSGLSVWVAPMVPRSRRVKVKLKVLMSFRPRLDHFRELAFLLGSSETLPEHLSSCENLCANPRLKLEGASIAFDIYTVGRLLLFPPCYALQMNFWARVSELTKGAKNLCLYVNVRLKAGCR